MNHLKKFENFDPEAFNPDSPEYMGKAITTNRMVSDFVYNHSSIAKIVSVIDDIIHLDWKSLKHSFKNKEGFKKLGWLVSEMGMLDRILDKEGNLDNLDYYDFDVDEMLRVLKDPTVVEYLENDPKVRKRLEGQPIYQLFKDAFDSLDNEDKDEVLSEELSPGHYAKVRAAGFKRGDTRGRNIAKLANDLKYRDYVGQKVSFKKKINGSIVNDTIKEVSLEMDAVCFITKVTNTLLVLRKDKKGKVTLIGDNHEYEVDRRTARLFAKAYNEQLAEQPNFSSVKTGEVPQY